MRLNKYYLLLMEIRRDLDDLVFETRSINGQVFLKLENERFNGTPHPRVWSRLKRSNVNIANLC